mmetsp:Transcript_37338/g.78759  ORF Transcript_37338/g.78759 Transcript_37338/m.78759 type:complete len:757 (-) Transcript_37338:187-2457(-)
MLRVGESAVVRPSISENHMVAVTMHTIMPTNNNTAPKAQDHCDDIRASSDKHNGPVGLSNGSEKDECTASSSPQTQTKFIHPALRRKQDLVAFKGSRRVSFDRNNFRSSLQTIESHAYSLDISEFEDDDSQLRSSRQSDASSVTTHRSMKRRHSLDRSMSSTNSLMVSFSKLSEQELSHLRKWNRRLQRTEVFDKYYFPAKWEANEMEALVGFLKLEDPASKVGGGGMRGGSLRGSGKKGQKGSALSESSVRRRNRAASGSWQSGDSGPGLSSSLTSSLTNSAGKLSKLLLNDPVQNTIDPVKVTRKALNFIFFPYIHDPKSVLLKRGSVFLGDSSLPNERELMVFSHGFLIASVVLDDAFSLFLALSDREFLTEKSFLDYLQNKFREMDEEETGEIEKWELQKLFTDIGIPMGENTLDELIRQSLLSTTVVDQTERVDWEELHKSLQGFFAQKNSGSSESTSSNAKSLDDSEHNNNGLKKLFGAFSGKRKTTKVEYASLFSNITRIDSLNISHGDDPTSEKIANSSYAHTCFSVTLSESKKDPLIFACSKTEHRDAWVEAFKPGVVRALAKSSAKGMTELRSKLGWQHLVVRSSFISLVILNDGEALEHALQEEEENNHRKLKLELNILDEYNGYSPLHYATILGQTDCMEALLKAGSTVTLEDREGFSPMYHALSLRNDEIANVLEKFGADRNDDLRKLIAQEIEAEDLKQRTDTLETHNERGENSITSDVSISERSNEDINNLLAQAASQFKS